MNAMTEKIIFKFCAVFLLIIAAGCTSLSAGPASQSGSEITSPSRPDSRVELEENSSLAQIISYGLKHNPGLQAQYHIWQAARGNTDASGALPEPAISYTWFAEEVETRVGPQQHKVSLSQKIPGFGKLSSQKELAIEKARTAFSDYENRKSELKHRIRTAYFRYASILRINTILEKNIDRLSLLEPVVQTSYKAGLTPFASLIRVQIALEQEKEKLAASKDTLVSIASSLNSLLDRAPESPLPQPDLKLPDSSRITALTDIEISSYLKRGNTGLHLLQNNIDSAKAGIQIARKSSTPDFSVGADWIITGEAENPVPESGKDPVALRFGITLPTNRGRYAGLLQQAREKLRASVMKKNELETNLKATVLTLLTDLKGADRVYTLYSANLLKKAEQSFEVARTSFISGKASFSELFEPFELILNLEIETEKIIVRKLIILSELDHIFGNLLEIFKEKENE